VGVGLAMGVGVGVGAGVRAGVGVGFGVGRRLGGVPDSVSLEWVDAEAVELALQAGGGGRWW